MAIHLPADDEHRLRQIAMEAGYESVEQYVTERVIAPAEEPAPLSEAELRESAASCDRAMAEAKTGLGIPLEEARELTLKELREKHA